MSEEIEFPKEILKDSVSARVSYFKSYTMPHKKLREVVKELIHLINQPSGASLVFVFGPTGVGKSTLLKKVQNDLIEQEWSAMEKDPGYIPITKVEAMTPEFGNFDWKDFYIRSLQSLEEPLIDKKIYPHSSSPNASPIKMKRTDTRLKLRFALESALQYRKTKTFLVDEAQNFGRVGSGRKLLDQTDCIKSLANISQTQFILCGTYELLSLRNLSAQLCRRSSDIHFPRYKANSESDLKDFRSVLNTFQAHLPLPEQPDLVDNWQFCYARSIGCVGILKDWLTKTLNGVLVQNANATTITLEDLKSYAWSEKQCLIMAQETCEEEKRLENDDVTNELHLALGLEEIATSKNPTLNQPKTLKNKKKKKGRRVGEPSPCRRPVGVEQNATQSSP